MCRLLICLFTFIVFIGGVQAQQVDDEAIRSFLKEHRNEWHDLNVPYEDGELLYELIIDHRYKSALEIGTSTGHSTIWIAWALSKTGGKLITIELDAKRQKEAIENIKSLGLSDFVDFRLGDAHTLVKKLTGPFDFVFSDADKDWYVQYFKDLQGKVNVGGCFTAHNVRNAYGGIKQFLDYVEKQNDFQTTIEGSTRAGVSISYKQ